MLPLQGRSFWESSPPMGPSESATRHRENQERRPTRLARRPRRRRCLLKGCEQSFAPRHVRQRYCSERCRQAARKWARWKAQQAYRGTRLGKEKRNGQSQRYRERVKSRKATASETVIDPARVIPSQEFFRSFLRPARLLRAIRAAAAKSFATLLLPGMSACAGVRRTAGAALERGTRLNPDILIGRPDSPYIQAV